MTDSIFFYALVGAFCSMDITFFGQFMICRPIFCAPIVGYFMGDINTGLWIGMIVELHWINAIPMGVIVPVDVSLISILSTFWACRYFIGMQEAAVFALVLAVPFAYFYRDMDISGRNFNIKIMHFIENGIKNQKYLRMYAGIYFGFFLFTARLFLFYLFAMYVGGIIYSGLYLQLSQFIILGLRNAWYLLPVVGFALVIKEFNIFRKLFCKEL
ncbi:MAG: PTS sugar transporter subunit IIC [Endomicrobium sp.]|jgi:mannose/fructose/N-acetylgalactosamine-specific phosphotransferase system component IIC|nr:PTS sugar transporter subunit IIC [Endomicrobium sp.]